MKRSDFKKLNSGFAGILGIIITLAIICVIVLVVFKDKNDGIVNKQIKNDLSKEGINTATYKTTIDSTRQKINVVNKDYSDRLKQLDDLNK